MKRIVALAGLIIALALSGVAPGAEADPRAAALIEGAKKEGKMVFYTSVETEFARLLTSGFEAKYPFIKTDIFRSNHACAFSVLDSNISAREHERQTRSDSLQLGGEIQAAHPGHT